jgi:carboxypeptidase C (cathepsin A)
MVEWQAHLCDHANVANTELAVALGGPGCSSTTGLLFELGPCTIIDNGEDTMTNPFSWNNLANVCWS